MHARIPCQGHAEVRPGLCGWRMTTSHLSATAKGAGSARVEEGPGDRHQGRAHHGRVLQGHVERLDSILWHLGSSAPAQHICCVAAGSGVWMLSCMQLGDRSGHV